VKPCCFLEELNDAGDTLMVVVHHQSLWGFTRLLRLFRCLGTETLTFCSVNVVTVSMRQPHVLLFFLLLCLANMVALPFSQSDFMTLFLHYQDVVTLLFN
jgi:hypothetical protein